MVCKIFLAAIGIGIGLGFVAPDARAINMSAVYYSACQRDIGVIIDVDEAKVHLLTLGGTVKKVPRFDIIYIATYPLGSPPIKRIDPGTEVDLITVKTLFKDQVVDLVKGWMIDHSDEQISFLTVEGDETVIDLNDIWDIEISPAREPIPFQNRAGRKETIQFDFFHPYPFAGCQKDRVPGTQGAADSGPASGALRTVYPQHLLGDPLLIKKELDRLQAGHQRIHDFHDDKTYYAVPQIYGNDTDLGVSLNFGSRYGASTNRANNFIPVVSSELSDGPFGFQRVWVTGAAPLFESIQEEVQTQLLYKLKADYLHFSIMYDVARVVIGESNYRWQPADLGEHDDRINEIFHIGGGFDRGVFAFDYTIMRAQYAIQHEELFFFSRANLQKFGLLFHFRNFKLDFYHAFGSDRKPGINEVAEGNTEEDIQEAEELLAAIPDFDGDFRIYRLNLTFLSWQDLSITYSGIFRRLRLNRQSDLDGLGQLSYYTRSITNALFMDLKLPADLKLFGYFSLESHTNRYGRTQIDATGSSLFPKGGLGISLKI